MSELENKSKKKDLEARRKDKGGKAERTRQRQAISRVVK
jgi:hypothetical protein